MSTQTTDLRPLIQPSRVHCAIHWNGQFAGATRLRDTTMAAAVTKFVRLALEESEFTELELASLMRELRQQLRRSAEASTIDVSLSVGPLNLSFRPAGHTAGGL